MGNGELCVSVWLLLLLLLLHASFSLHSRRLIHDMLPNNSDVFVLAPRTLTKYNLGGSHFAVSTARRTHSHTSSHFTCP